MTWSTTLNSLNGKPGKIKKILIKRRIHDFCYCSEIYCNNLGELSNKISGKVWEFFPKGVGGVMDVKAKFPYYDLGFCF